MVLFIAYHATPARNRQSIARDGLLAYQPCEDQMCGVYCFDPHMDNYGGSFAQSCGWASGRGQDVWRVVYCGPMWPDPCLTNAVVLPPVTDVTLVTGNE